MSRVTLCNHGEPEETTPAAQASFADHSLLTPGEKASTRPEAE